MFSDIRNKTLTDVCVVRMYMRLHLRVVRQNCQTIIVLFVVVVSLFNGKHVSDTSIIVERNNYAPKKNERETTQKNGKQKS